MMYVVKFYNLLQTKAIALYKGNTLMTNQPQNNKIQLVNLDYPEEYFKTATLDDKRIAYTKDTVFKIQIGKGPNGSYETICICKGNLTKAMLIYNNINIGNGFKKRLFCPTMNKPVLARQFSSKN